MSYRPAYVQAVLAAAAAAEIRPVARARAPHDPASPALIAVMRDEALRLPGFLAHYRGLGVSRFVILDHGSTDGLGDRLAAEPDVDLYAVAGAFAGKQAWLTALIARTGLDRWYLAVDADERLVFDGAAVHGAPGRSLADLVAFATAQGLCRVRGMLVDLYPPGPLIAPTGPAELFDAAGYTERLRIEMVSRRGGPRRRALGSDPELSKYPLFHIAAGEVAANPHHLHPYPAGYPSDCFLGLLHDKFGPDFLPKTRRAAAERNYWAESLEYRRTLAALEREPELGLAWPGSRRYRRPADLIAAGLIAPIPWGGGPAARVRARLRAAIARRRGAVRQG